MFVFLRQIILHASTNFRVTLMSVFSYDCMNTPKALSMRTGAASVGVVLKENETSLSWLEGAASTNAIRRVYVHTWALKSGRLRQARHLKL